MLNLLELLDVYHNYLDSLKTPENTLKNYNVVLNKFLVFIRSNGVDVCRIDEKQFQQLTYKYVDSIKTYVKNGKVCRYSANSVNAKRSYLRSFISFLEKRDYIKNHFSHKIEDLKRDPGEEQSVLSMEEMELIRDILFDEVKEAEGERYFLALRNRVAYYMLLLTGMRVSEATNLKWSNIDMVKETILIEKGKGNKTRIIPMLSQLKGIIRDYMDEIEKLGDKYNVKSEYVLTSFRKSKKPLSSSTVYRIIKDIMAKAGVTKPITCHNLRHTFVSLAIDKGFNHVALSKILGHANPSTFNKVYAHILSEKQLKKDMKKFEDLRL